ncbi:MAG: rhomboid family intramembrane serine protease [Saprospiraceae bacterium]|jgi:membrane associated rhomboid family serine protease
MKQAIKAALSLSGIIWLFFIIDWIPGIQLGAYGLYPRHVDGLVGIIMAPLIHSGWGHLLSNTPPILFLVGLIFFFYRPIALPVLLFIWLSTGILVWIFGRPVYHIGASGVLYGLVAFVFWNGIFRRDVKSIALSLLVLFYFGSLITGILPGQEGISWESHLLGGISGIITAYLFRNKTKPPLDESEGINQEEEAHYFLERDIFDK